MTKCHFIESSFCRNMKGRNANLANVTLSARSGLHKSLRLCSGAGWAAKRAGRGAFVKLRKSSTSMFISQNQFTIFTYFLIHVIIFLVRLPSTVIWICRANSVLFPFVRSLPIRYLPHACSAWFYRLPTICHGLN